MPKPTIRRHVPDRIRTRGERVIAFVEEYCVTPDGMHIGKPMLLDPFQKRFILDVYDNKRATTRRAYLSMGRKNGKTALIAAIVLAHLVGPEARRNSQIVSGAQSRDQAALVFALAAKMVRLNPALRAIVSITPSVKKLVGITRNVEYQAISAEGKTAYGLSPVLALLDEVGQVRGPQDNFIDAIITSQGAHADPLLIVISTQAPNDADLLSLWIDDAKTSKDPRIVCHVYTTDESKALDDEEGWKQSNPALSTFRDYTDVKESAERAMRIPSFEPTFRNLYLNQRVELFSPFISRGIWVLNSGEVDSTAFYECPVYGGMDLSGKADLTALVLVAFKDEKWHVKAYFWTPEKGLKERAHQSRTPLEEWVRKDLITAVPGASIDYEMVAQDMVEILDGMNVKAMAFDRWRFDLLQKELEKVGLSKLNLVPFGQGFRDMSPALEAVETALLNEQMAHGGNPVLTMCAANSRVEMDAAGNRKLSKFKAVGRIDGMVALCEAMGIANAKPDKPRSYQALFL